MTRIPLPEGAEETLELAHLYLCSHHPEEAATWAQIATDTLACEGRPLDALVAQISAARARLRAGEEDDARELLRDVASATQTLFQVDGDDDAPEMAPFRFLRGYFALAAAELRLETQELEEALQLYTDALQDLQGGTQPSLVFECEQAMGFIYLLHGQTEQAISHLRNASRVADGQHAIREQLQVNLTLMTQLIHGGAYEQAHRLSERNVERAQASGDRTKAAAFAGMAAMASTMAKDSANAVESALRALDTYAQAGEPWGYAQMITLIANGQLLQEDHLEALRTLLSGVAALRAQGLPLPAELLQAQVGEMQANLGAEAFARLADSLLDDLPQENRPPQSPPPADEPART